MTKSSDNAKINMTHDTNFAKKKQPENSSTPGIITARRMLMVSWTFPPP